MRAFDTIDSLAAHVFERPKTGGYCYLLIAKSLFKIGSTIRPVGRIGQQEEVGAWDYTEPVSQIFITAPFRKFREAEKRIKMAAFCALRFAPYSNHAGSRPVESFRHEVLPLFKQALAAAEAGDTPAFRQLLKEIERKACSMDAPPPRLRRTSAATESASRRSTPRSAKKMGGRAK